MKTRVATAIGVIVLAIAMLVQGIFLLITVQTANVQYPAQPPSAIFPNHSFIVDSPIADASILGKLLKQGDGCVVYLYNHKSWKSAQVAVTVPPWPMIIEVLNG